jgi:hypothetical protein
MKIKPKPKPIDKKEANDVSAAVQMAANNFMLIQVTVGMWRGTADLKEAGAKAAKVAGADEDSHTVNSRLLGVQHAHLQKVLREWCKIQSYTYLYGSAYERANRMVFVGQVTEVIAHLVALLKNAEERLVTFLENYDDYIKQALANDHGQWANEVKRHLPTVDQLRAKFHCTIHDPKPIPAMDMERYGVVPASVLGKIVAQSNRALSAKLESAKQDTLTTALKAAENALSKLTDGERFHQSVIDNVVREGEKLRGLADGYDNDHRVRIIADDMLKGIANVDNTDGWKNNETKKLEAKKAATKTVKNLKRMKKSPPVAEQKPEIKLFSDPQPIVPDDIADLL